MRELKEMISANSGQEFCYVPPLDEAAAANFSQRVAWDNMLMHPADIGGAGVAGREMDGFEKKN